jgi:hypothetical protein
MTRRTLGFRTVVCAVAAGGLFAGGVLTTSGCTRTERRVTAQQAAQAAAMSVTTTAAGHTTTTPGRRSIGVKPNGRGGFDASEAQKAALARAHYMRDHHNDIMKPFRPTTRPTSQPVTRR